MKPIAVKIATILLLALFLWPAWASAQKQRYSIPSPARMKSACELTRGTWEHLPKYCNDMRPQTWHQLNPQQQRTCYDKFHEPCECGPGMRFSIQPILGCITSNFAEDYWE